MIKFFRTLTTMPKNVFREKNPTAEHALNEIKELWKTGQLREALHKIDQIEENYPSCTKAAKYYRGEIGYELLEKSGKLPKKPSFK